MEKERVKILLIILACFFPFISVYIVKGAGRDLLINILLCLLFYLPGIIHGVIVIVNNDEAEGAREIVRQERRIESTV